MGGQAAIRRALEEGDVAQLQRAHAEFFPHLPTAPSQEAAEAQMHMARTQSAWLAFPKRAYSHAWLTERGLPSQLPDHLKPKAQRLYPVVVEAVLVSANTNSPALKPVMAQVERAMSDAVEECFADGRKDPAFVRARIADARDRALKQLI